MHNAIKSSLALEEDILVFVKISEKMLEVVYVVMVNVDLVQNSVHGEGGSDCAAE